MINSDLNKWIQHLEIVLDLFIKEMSSGLGQKVEKRKKKEMSSIYSEKHQQK